VELPERDRALVAVLRDRDDRRRVVAAAEHVFGEVQVRIRKEPRTGHAIEVDGDSRSALALHGGELPERVPERRRVADREAMNLAEIIQLPPEPPAGEAREGCQPRRRDAIGTRPPERRHLAPRSSRHSRQRFARVNSSWSRVASVPIEAGTVTIIA
jgi:hypothetical protein